MCAPQPQRDASVVNVRSGGAGVKGNLEEQSTIEGSPECGAEVTEAVSESR